MHRHVIVNRKITIFVTDCQILLFKNVMINIREIEIHIIIVMFVPVVCVNP